MMLRRKANGRSIWTVYILRCADGTLYTGVAADLAARLATHRAGKGARYTRSRLPVRLVYREAALDRSAAQKREWAIKQLTRAGKRALIASHRTSSPSSRRRSASARPSSPTRA